MNPITLEILTERLELGDQLQAGRSSMLEPQDLPGRYGRVVRALDHLLQVTQIPSVLGGGWAVWRHGYVARLTYDIDIALPAEQIDEFLRVASVSGFELLPLQEGRWPKMIHKETGIKVDILPEGARPGSASKPAPTTIPHPNVMGAASGILKYISFPSLVELKIAAGRAKDYGDVVEMIRANPSELDKVRLHLAGIHTDYAATFDHLAESAREQQDQ